MKAFWANIYADGKYCGRMYVPIKEKIIFADVANPLYGKKLTCEPVNE